MSWCVHDSVHGTIGGNEYEGIKGWTARGQENVPRNRSWQRKIWSCNGEKLQEDYLQSGVVTDMHQDATHEGNFTGFTVPENCVFCLGDNRTGSRDCRSFGCIPLEKIEGKVLFRFWPLNKFGKV